MRERSYHALVHGFWITQYLGSCCLSELNLQFVEPGVVEFGNWCLYLQIRKGKENPISRRTCQFTKWRWEGLACANEDDHWRTWEILESQWRLPRTCWCWCQRCFMKTLFFSLDPGSANCWSMLFVVSLCDLHLGCIIDTRCVGYCNNIANASQALTKWATNFLRTIFGNF